MIERIALYFFSSTKRKETGKRFANKNVQASFIIDSIIKPSIDSDKQIELKINSYNRRC